MIKVTVWSEFRQENEENDNALRIRKIHPQGIHQTIADFLEKNDDMLVRTATLDMPECGLGDEVLEDTDVLIWWAHVAHHEVPDQLVEKIHKRILDGMGFIALHSAHCCKVLQRTLGSSGSLRWRENDFSRVWNLCPTHPIAQGIPEFFELEQEEMYGEYFDIPKPDDVVFTSWFRGGEVIRSGCTWTRGKGKFFFFQPGHETNPSYHNEYVQRIISNAVRWAKTKVDFEIKITHAQESPESIYQKGKNNE